MLITLSPSTVGVKARLTPNCLNSTVIELAPLPPPLPPDCATGTGNSPPARNEAFSPESATSVGERLGEALAFEAVDHRIDAETADVEALAEDAHLPGQRAVGEDRVARHGRGNGRAADGRGDRGILARQERGTLAGHRAERAGGVEATHAHADFLADAAAHFGEADFEHDLLARADRDQVDHLVAGIGLGHLHRAVDCAGIADEAGQDD
jgi:hypothetical protein